jgi:hypothetical protein
MKIMKSKGHGSEKLKIVDFKYSISLHIKVSLDRCNKGFAESIGEKNTSQ